MRIAGVTAAVLVLAFAAAPAAAQQQGPGPGGRREQMTRRVEEIRIARMKEALKLDERTAEKFFPAITALDARRKTLMVERRQHLFELRKQLDAQTPDQDKLAAILKLIRRNESDLMELREKERGTVKDHLTVEQQARYVIFQMEFHREVRGFIDEVRGPRQGRGPGRGPGMGPGGMGTPPGAAE